MAHRAIQITLEESRSFARLSGDWNPIHVDPIAARRLMFGSTVVHGVDVLIRTIAEAFRQNSGGALTSLNATFVSPLRTSSRATIEAVHDDNNDPLRGSYRVVADGKLVQKVS